MYRPVDLIEVRAWGATVGGVSIDPGLGYYVFEYDPKWQARGIELAPLTMPVSQSLHVFPLLPEAPTNVCRRCSPTPCPTTSAMR